MKLAISMVHEPRNFGRLRIDKNLKTLINKTGLFSLTMFLILLNISGCGAKDSSVSPPCPIDDLMIDLSMFPESWYQQGPPIEKAALVRWGVEKLGVNFISQEHGVAQQDAYRGRNFDETEAKYLDRISSTAWFRVKADETEWYIPSDFNYESPIADHYQFGCQTHKPSGVERCQLVGQYGVYLTWFHTYMSPIMTYDDLEHILRTIDNKVAQCLGR